jgi:hypothetical protein
MGLLNLFSKPAPTLLRLPAGSFTVDRDGRVLTGTLPSSFPAQLVRQIAEHVRAAFSEAAVAHLPLAELIIHYPSFKISARELRGGAIIYLAPKIPVSPMSQS